MASPVLEPKKIKARSLFQVVMSNHVNHPTQARMIDPSVAETKPTRFGRGKPVGLIIGLEGMETFSVVPRIW